MNRRFGLVAARGHIGGDARRLSQPSHMRAPVDSTATGDRRECRRRPLRASLAARRIPSRRRRHRLPLWTRAVPGWPAARLSSGASRRGRTVAAEPDDQRDARPCRRPRAASAPFWSPDGTRIGFFAAGRLRAIDLANGSVTDLAEAPSGRGAAWNAAGDLVFAATGDGGLTRRAAGRCESAASRHSTRRTANRRIAGRRSCPTAVTSSSSCARPSDRAAASGSRRSTIPRRDERLMAADGQAIVAGNDAAVC